MKYMLLIALLITCSMPLTASAEFIPDTKEKVNQLVNAIYKAENSTKYPYGIKSIDTKGNKEYARKICVNTVKNNVKRWKDSVKKGDKRSYLKFLGDRFCPPKAHKKNVNWLPNVRWFLKQHKQGIKG